jgi:hypothetical protein
MTKQGKQKGSNIFSDPDDESIRDKVNALFKKHPKDYISKLEDLGFKYHDDDETDLEAEEEAKAKPLNANQRYLVKFFNGKIPLSDRMVEIFLEEKRHPSPNYPLFRKYFTSSNKNLFTLILHGLRLYPVSDELLSDLAFYHEFKGILKEVIDHFIVACEKQENLEVFSETVQDFYYATAPDGFDAFYELKQRFQVGLKKRAVIDFLEELEDSCVDENSNKDKQN